MIIDFTNNRQLLPSAGDTEPTDTNILILGVPFGRSTTTGIDALRIIRKPLTISDQAVVRPLPDSLCAKVSEPYKRGPYCSNLN